MAQEKEEQKKLLIEVMQADEKDGLYKTSNMAQQTAVEWFLQELIRCGWFKEGQINITLEQAKQIEKKQMIGFAEFVATHPDKNKNYLGEMLHAKSKYDSSERTSDLLEQYYNETYKKDI